MNNRFSVFFAGLILTFFLTACGGTLSVEVDATGTPDAAQSATLAALETRVATLQPGFRPLDLNSSPEEIRLAMLNSHESWQTLWIDGLVVQYLPEGDNPISTHAQLWVDRPGARFRSLSGPLEQIPEALQVSDGISVMNVALPGGDSQTHPLDEFARDAGWKAPQQLSDTINYYPLDMAIDAPLSEMVFSTNLAQRGGTFTPTGMEKIAGRPALLVEWTPDNPENERYERFWLDTRTGMPLRWQGFRRTGEEATPSIQILSEMITNSMEYDLALPNELFSLQVQEPPMFALDASGASGPTLVPPQTEFIPGAGELYFVIDRTPDALQLVRLPGNCVTGADPCPAPSVIEGYPNQNLYVEPLVWSPDGKLAVLVHNGELYRYSPETGEWRAMAQFPMVMNPVWSRDGLSVAFVAQMEDNVQDIHIIRSDGSDLQNLTNGQFHGAETHHWVNGWLDDGRVVFQVIERTTARLYAQRLGESEAGLLSDAALMNSVVSLSPDGQELVYSAQNDGATTLFLSPVSALGSGEEPRRLGTFQQSSIAQILWSPDGVWIAFMVNSATGPENNVATVYAIRTDGTDLRQLFQQPNVRSLTMTSDGRHLIAEGMVNGRLTVIPIEGGASRTLDAPGLRLDQSLLGVSYR